MIIVVPDPQVADDATVSRLSSRELHPVEIQVRLSCHVKEYELEYIYAVRQAVEILMCDEEIWPAGY
jgi:hypothetical protein